MPLILSKAMRRQIMKSSRSRVRPKFEILELGHGPESLLRLLLNSKFTLPPLFSYTGIDHPAGMAPLKKQLEKIPETRLKQVQLAAMLGGKTPKVALPSQVDEFARNTNAHLKELGNLKKAHGNPFLEFLEKDAADFPDEWNSRFDVVFARDFFNSGVKNPEKIMQSVYKALKPGGRLVMYNVKAPARIAGQEIHSGPELALAHGGFKPEEGERFLKEYYEHHYAGPKTIESVPSLISRISWPPSLDFTPFPVFIKNPKINKSKNANAQKKKLPGVTDYSVVADCDTLELPQPPAVREEAMKNLTGKLNWNWIPYNYPYVMRRFETSRHLVGKKNFAEALAHANWSEEILPFLLNQYGKESGEVKKHVAGALGSFYENREAFSFLTREFEKADAETKMAILDSARRISGKLAKPFLLSQLKNKNAKIKIRAAELLGGYSDEGVIKPLLETLFKTKNQLVRWHLSEILRFRRFYGTPPEDAHAKALSIINGQYPYLSSTIEHPEVLKKAVKAALAGKITEGTAKSYMDELRRKYNR